MGTLHKEKGSISYSNTVAAIYLEIECSLRTFSSSFTDELSLLYCPLGID
jgi:hypothetical protein